LGRYAWIEKGIRYVADCELPEGYTQKIASLSLGGPTKSTSLLRAIQYAQSKGVVVVAAAGNAGYQGADTVGYPGKYREVITVASIRQNESPSSFSSGGEAVDVAAPGDMVYSTHTGGGYALLSGTSMATPHVAGAMALIMSLNPTVTDPGELEKLLTEKCKDVYSLGKDIRTGSGAPILTNYVPAEQPEEEPEPEDPTEKEKLAILLGQIFLSRKDVSRMNEATVVRMGLLLGADVNRRYRKSQNVDRTWQKINTNGTT
jgi:subtilisin family serine protease